MPRDDFVEGPAEERPRRATGESWLTEGLAGIAAVTGATLLLAAAGFLIALLVSIAF